jgi:hypothetical protein
VVNQVACVINTRDFFVHWSIAAIGTGSFSFLISEDRQLWKMIAESEGNIIRHVHAKCPFK